MKLNLGAGNDIRSDFINHDVADLLGIEIVMIKVLFIYLIGLK